ncbi:hypothetical protein [Sphingorhabdus sp. YGSMI21]|uniref:hypothetical protein n=1 Tax=Sphingorhabdus sp. YGSMI21 TaxID=2077182 RepID=UPI000F4FB226|nr:hypothetical protein [Sphingorhabdus sp. YGSMI21]
MEKAKPKDGATTLKISVEKGKSESRQMAEVAMRPMIRNGFIVGSLGSKYFSGEQPDLTETVDIMAEACAKVRTNDLSDQRDILTSQAMALDAIFTAMVLRSENNLKDYFDASQRFMRMAMKAQAQCRTTIEALDRLARGGEQVIKHVHVDNRGGQAVIADNVQTGGQNGKIEKQPHAVAALGIPDPQSVRSKDAKSEIVQISRNG